METLLFGRCLRFFLARLRNPIIDALFLKLSKNLQTEGTDAKIISSEFGLPILFAKFSISLVHVKQVYIFVLLLEQLSQLLIGLF